jgi:hypothetical protein
MPSEVEGFSKAVPSEEDHQLANDLVARAVERFRHLVPGEDLEDLHDLLAILLLGTIEGRRMLSRARPVSGRGRSDEIDRGMFLDMVARMKAKDGTG